MMKINRLVVLITFVLSSILLKAQDCTYRTDSVYYVNIQGILNNDQPVFTQFVISNIDTLLYYLDNMQDNFLCEIFMNAVFVTEPYLGFIDMNGCLGDDAEKEFTAFNNKLLILNKKSKEVFSFSNNQFKIIHVSIIKTISEFWILPIDFSQINNTSETIQIQKECYGFEHYYKFKKIIAVIPLSKREKKLFN